MVGFLLLNFLHRPASRLLAVPWYSCRQMFSPQKVENPSKHPFHKMDFSIADAVPMFRPYVSNTDALNPFGKKIVQSFVATRCYRNLVCVFFAVFNHGPVQFFMTIIVYKWSVHIPRPRKWANACFSFSNIPTRITRSVSGYLTSVFLTPSQRAYAACLFHWWVRVIGRWRLTENPDEAVYDGIYIWLNMFYFSVFLFFLYSPPACVHPSVWFYRHSDLTSSLFVILVSSPNHFRTFSETWSLRIEVEMQSCISPAQYLTYSTRCDSSVAFTRGWHRQVPAEVSPCIASRSARRYLLGWGKFCDSHNSAYPVSIVSYIYCVIYIVYTLYIIVHNKLMNI